ncbi:MAG: hypothetical protein VB108_08110 [Anaerolineaceae bacterium]|nr:hypothetical protein [Anaerolineaceae bacterium]
MEKFLTEVRDFESEDTRTYYEKVSLETEEIRRFLGLFKRASKNYAKLSALYEDYLFKEVENSELEAMHEAMPSEHLIVPLLAEEHALVQQLLLACAKFSNL